MSGLGDFAALQARVYAFLAQQDESTLGAIVDGTVRLAVTTAGRAPVQVEPVRTLDPFAAAQELTRLPSAEQRQRYLAASGFTVAALRKIAKLRDLSGYSKLNRADLTNLLAEDPSGQGDASAEEARSMEPMAPDPAGARSPAGSNVDAVAIAARLREIETEAEGMAYLREQHLDHDGLLAVAAALELTRVNRLRSAELERRVLKQAIGARRKFAGLRKW